MASQVFSGAGDPNGVVDGSPGDVYQDQAGKLWLNTAAPSTWASLTTASSTAPGLFGNRFMGDSVLGAGTTSAFKHLFFGDLTVPAGSTLTWSRVDSIAGLGNLGYCLFVDGTLTIEPGGLLDLSGDPGAGTIGGQGAANGGGRTSGGNGTIGNGTDAPNLSQSWFDGAADPTLKGGDGGSGAGGANTGGQGGTATLYSIDDSPPFALNFFSPISRQLGALFGGCGGGGGAGDGALPGGGGGGPGGIWYIFARKIVAPAGSIRARGGDGEAGPTVDTGGGGGGMGGIVNIYTLDEAFNPAIVNVGGGTGGASGGGTGAPGQAGHDGRVFVMRPSGTTVIG